MSEEMNIDAESGNKILIAGSPGDEFIVNIDFHYCDVHYSGYRIMERSEISKLCDALGSGREIGAPNMPGDWCEEFDISELKGAFKIHSSDEDDIAAMRNLFGYNIGNTDLIDCALNCLGDGSSDAANNDEEDQITVSYIDLETAGKFIEDPDHYDLSNATGLDDDAAELLAKHPDDLYLYSLEEISLPSAKALAKHEGDILQLSSLVEISAPVAEALSNHQGGIILDLGGLADISDSVAEHLSFHPGILNLNGITKISDTAAEHLSNHQGAIDLFGLNQVSDAAIVALSKKEGTICGEDPADWLKSLSANEN